MNKILLTLLEAIVLLNFGVVLGFVLNGARGDDSIKLCHNYYPSIDAARFRPSTRPAPSEPKPMATTVPSSPVELDQPEDPSLEPFRVLRFDQVVELWNHPNYQTGLYVFIDARNDSAYEAGHIPGAHQCDYYRWQKYVEQVIPVVLGAEKVVVYCNGGDCEDSLYVCGNLIDYEVPWENIYLYKGGWEEWEASGKPVATGREAE